MATLHSNKSVGDLQGTMGNLVYVHRADGTVVVRRVAKPRSGFNAPQKANQSRFAQAQLYVKRLKANPDQYAPYKLAARISHKRSCDLAMSDFLNPPSLTDIDLSAYTGKAGEPIRIQASDDIAVHSVSLAITHMNEMLIEQGSAVFDKKTLLWTYLTQAAVVPGETVIIGVTAADRPGNTIIKTVHHALVLPA